MTSIRSLAFFLTILASLPSPMPATAAVIFDNGAPDLIDAFISDADGIGFRVADNFALTTGQTTIRDIHWWGMYDPNSTPPATDNFTIEIRSDNTGVPGAVLVSLGVGNANRVVTGDTIGPDSDVFAYSVDVSPIVLSAGTPYWLSIFNNTTTDTDDDWLWATSAQSGNAQIAVGSDPSWSSLGVEMAFNLTDDVADGQVPEPSTLLLLGSGLASLAVWRRRRK